MPLFLTSADACWSLPGIIIQTAVGRLFRPVAFGAPLANRNGAASNGFKDCLLSFLHFGSPLQHPRDKEKRSFVLLLRLSAKYFVLRWIVS